MSTPTIEMLTLLGSYLTIYCGIPLLIAGTVGGLLNMMVFLSLRTFRENPCTFYLTVISLANLGGLWSGLFSRIMITGSSIDWTQTSLFFCKCRLFFSILCGLISFTCLSLAMIDQYLATCRRPRWQGWSNIKLAQRLAAVFSLTWLLHGIPYLIFFNHSPSSNSNHVICTSTNNIFTQYRTYVVGCVLYGCLPLPIAFTFGLLAFRNVRELSYRAVPLMRRELDKQLTAMALIHALTNCLGTTPYIIINLLVSGTDLTKDSLVGAQLQFAFTIATLLIYANFASPFYIYLCASERFCHQLMHVLINVRFCRYPRRRILDNQTVPGI